MRSFTIYSQISYEATKGKKKLIGWEQNETKAEKKYKFLLACCWVIYNELIMSFIKKKYQNTCVTNIVQESVDVYNNDRQYSVPCCCLDTNNIFGTQTINQTCIAHFREEKFIQFQNYYYYRENCHGNLWTWLFSIVTGKNYKSRYYFFATEILKMFILRIVDIFNHIHITHPII